MSKITIPIRGMHCRSCEILIENNIKKIDGVKKVEVSHKSGRADVFFEQNTAPSAALKQAIQDSGYEVGAKGKLPWLSKNKYDYINFLKGAVILIFIYLIAERFGLFGISVNTESTSLMVVLLVGLVAGISTCMALVGGLVLSLAARHAELHPEITPKEKFVPHLYFNLGRIIGFAVLGGAIGLIGSALSPSTRVIGFMTVAIGAVMIFLGLKLVEIFPALKDKSIALPKSISQFLGVGREQKEYSHKNSFYTGALTFFLPCGFTQAMQLFAVSSGNFIQGALIMSLFAIGTAPGLLGVGGLASVFQGKQAKVFFAATGIAVILLGWFNIANGSQLLFQTKIDADQGEIINSTGIQEIRMTQGNGGYSPNKFTVEKGKTVRWIITSTNQFSCASALVVPKYGISENLVKGENIIEFVPTQTGDIPFSCSMGMYRGVIKVVEPGTTKKTSAINTNVPVAQAAAAPSGSCSTGGGGCGCGGARVKPSSDSTPVNATIESGVQLIKTEYSEEKGIFPNNFVVKKGIPARFEITAKDDGEGCSNSIVVQGLHDQAEYLRSGNKIIMDFTAEQNGDFAITCGMGMINWGKITIIN